MSLASHLSPFAARRPRRPRKARRPRVQLTLQVLEDRNLLSVLSVGINVDVSQQPGSEWQGTIAIDPTNPTHLFAASNQAGGGLFAASSTDAGATWTPSDPSAFDAGSAEPKAAFDDFGNLFLAYADGGGLVLDTSTDGGQTFAPLLTTDASGYGRPALAVGAGSVWLAARAPDGTVAAAGAPVTGLGTVGTFSAWQAVPNSAGGDFPSVAVGPTGQVLVAYESPADGSGPATLYTSQDPNGLNQPRFNNPVTVATTQVGGERILPAQPDAGIDAEPELAWDRSGGLYNGRVYLVYTDAPSAASDNTGIFLRYSTNNGQTWTSAFAVTDDTSGNSHFDPALAVDQSNGHVGVAWLDARRDRGQGGPGDTDGIPNDDVQTFAAVSYNGGFTFVANTQVSDPGGASNAAAVGSPADFGRSLGLAFFGNALYPLWPDNSPALAGNPDAPNLDLATVRVDVYPNVLTNEHPELTTNYVNSTWNQDVLERNSNTFYPADQVILYAGPNAYTPAPPFLGVDYIWLLPQTQNPRVLYMGISAEQTPPGTFARYFLNDPRIGGGSGGTDEWIKNQLIDVRGPGAFFAWQTNSFGQPTIWIDSLNGIDDTDYLLNYSGGHSHYNWGFSAPGVYQVDFQASAYLHYPDQPTNSGVVTYTFCVEAADNGDPPAPAAALPAALRTPPPPLNLGLLPAPQGLAPSLPSTPNPSHLGDGVAVEKPPSNTPSVDGAFAHAALQGRRTGSPVPDPADLSLGDGLVNDRGWLTDS